MPEPPPPVRPAPEIPPPVVHPDPTPAPPVASNPPVKKTRKKNKPPQQATPVPAAPQASGPPPVQLRQMLNDDERLRYNQAIDQSLHRARTNLTFITAHKLTNQQNALLSQIQSFLRQCEEARKIDDLGTARGFASKADLLAGDLAKSVAQ
jgi:hypothetical protein